MNHGPTPPGRPSRAQVAEAHQPVADPAVPRSTIQVPAPHESALMKDTAEPDAPRGHSRSSTIRVAWVTLGLGLTALGGLGIILPGLPSTMFFVGAAACFSRSSTRFERWLLSIPVVGTLVDDYREGRGMPVMSKAITVFLITAFSTLAVLRVDATPVKWVIGIAAAMGITAVTFYVPTRRDP